MSGRGALRGRSGHTQGGMVSDVRKATGMKTAAQIREAIKQVEADYAHVLTGKVSTVSVNAPRALMQLEAQAKLRALHWCLGTKYESTLRGVE